MFSKIRSFKDDYFSGTEREHILLPTIKQFFNDDSISQTKDKMCKYDFVSEKHATKYELKSRNNRMKAYNTTMIGCDKLCDNLVLLFKYTDGLYYINYNEELFKTFPRCLFRRENRKDHNDVEKMYCYIPIEHLREIKL